MKQLENFLLDTNVLFSGKLQIQKVKNGSKKKFSALLNVKNKFNNTFKEIKDFLYTKVFITFGFWLPAESVPKYSVYGIRSAH